MPVTQIPMKPGSWQATLKSTVPEEIIAALRIREDTLGAFASIYITPAWQPLELLGFDGLLATAVYVGRLLDRDGRGTLTGDGLESWLGDPDGKGLLQIPWWPSPGIDFETAWDWVRHLHAGSEIPKGTYWPETGDFIWNGSDQYRTLRDVAELMRRFWSVEWRINPDGTLDVGSKENLYGTTAAALFHPRARVNEPGLPPILGGTAQPFESCADYVSGIKIYGSTDADDFALGEYNRPDALGVVEPWFSPAAEGSAGTAILSRSVPPVGTYEDSTDLDLQAGVMIAFTDKLRETLVLELDQYDPSLMLLGKPVDVWDPDSDIFDHSAQQIWVAGEPCWPKSKRCVELEWGIPPGAGVFVQPGDGSIEPEARPIYDLTPHIDWTAERTGATVTLGAPLPRWAERLRNPYETWIGG